MAKLHHILQYQIGIDKCHNRKKERAETKEKVKDALASPSGLIFQIGLGKECRRSEKKH